MQPVSIDNIIKTNIISLFFINNDSQYCVQSYKLIPTFGITAFNLQRKNGNSDAEVLMIYGQARNKGILCFGRNKYYI